jgi:hypothetical protein
MTIGCGSGWAKDRIGPALALADSGLVDYLAFDCLGERTVALAQLRRLEDPRTGHDQRLPQIVRGLGGFLSRGKRAVGNFGGANPDAAAAEVIGLLREIGLIGLKVGVIRGDDVLEQARKQDVELVEMGGARLSEIEDQVVSANAYIGAEGIRTLLEQDARFVLGGRIADPSLYVGAIAYEMGWELDDWDRVALATTAAHLMECATAVTGGNFADPPYRSVHDISNLGFPYSEISDGEILLTKLADWGGAVNIEQTKLQLAFEIHDPRAYITPDVIVDVSQTRVRSDGRDRVAVTGMTGRERPANLKVLVGLDLGWKAVGEMSFGGPGCVDRARLGEQMLRDWVEPYMPDIDDIEYSMHGLTSLFGEIDPGNPNEVRVRMALRARSREVAQQATEMVEHLWEAGPAGAGGATVRLDRAISVTPAYLPRELVGIETEVLVS